MISGRVDLRKAIGVPQEGQNSRRPVSLDAKDLHLAFDDAKFIGPDEEQLHNWTARLLLADVAMTAQASARRIVALVPDSTAQAAPGDC